VLAPAVTAELDEALAVPPERGMVARGLGRSYGDAAQRSGGRVVQLTGWTGVDLDRDAGLCRVRAGTSVDTLLRVLVPRGWFVPVTAGTRFITIGGAIAADIHGKNHHRQGSFGDHLVEVVLRTPDGRRRSIGPDREAPLFWATVGGMGLTGVIEEATFRAKPIETSRLCVLAERAANLDAVLSRLAELDQQAEYTVAWVDLAATGARAGRSVITSGRFVTRDELPSKWARRPLAYDPALPVDVPVTPPAVVLNPLSIRAFNELWFRKAPRRPTESLNSIGAFFHPLDLVGSWNRIYGSRGFLQWQCVVPDAETAALRRIMEEFTRTGGRSFLTVLKRFGPGNAGPLSFPMAGWTLAVDVPVGNPSLPRLLDRLDRQVVEAGGRIYLAKDARMRPELLGDMYPRLDEFRAIRAEVDPQRVLRSDLSERLGLS
jgi:decaprenylphospho-beta-D-ribofuranose 2-oxidase